MAVLLMPGWILRIDSSVGEVPPECRALVASISGHTSWSAPEPSAATFLMRLPQAVRAKAAPTSTHAMALYRMKVFISSPQSHCAAVRQCGLSVHDRDRPPVSSFALYQTIDDPAPTTYRPCT